MAITKGRASSTYQTTSGSYETAFQASDSSSAARSIKITAATQAILVRVTGVHGAGATLAEYLLDSGESVEFSAMNPGGGGLITLFEVKEGPVAGGTVKWTVAIA
jgi:hypothetical protein